MTINIADEIVRLALQLVVLGVSGSFVTWLFSRVQKQREFRLQVIREFSKIHGQFVALRYEYNSFHINGRGKRSARFHPLSDDEIRKQKWQYFQKACGLIGDLQALKPLILEAFPKTKGDLDFIFSKYQDWRRLISSDKPILQADNGKNDDAYDQLRTVYRQIVHNMRKRI